ncbi:unnamed protein product [Prunus brigantina]
MKNTPSSHNLHSNRRKPISNFQYEDANNNKPKRQRFAALKAGVKKVAGVFKILLFGQREAIPKGAAVIDARRTNTRISGISSSTDISTGSDTKSKSSSKFKLSQSNSSSSALSGVIETKNFSYEEIFKATEKFSPANKIGDGAFGTVYKGRLGDGSLVAVKRAKKATYDKLIALEFKNEILTLSMIEHLNLVRLYGYLEHGDERIIVVEYVGNGTLREHLDGTLGNGLEAGERLDIAIDVAHAITYLHMYTDPPIIHRDIKSLNILITEKFRAKVADFGFARLSADPNATHISTQIKGTAGYLDPEYLKTYQLTEKSDVYSFGVLLVELMTGRRPIESQKPANERLTTRWVRIQVFKHPEIEHKDRSHRSSSRNTHLIPYAARETFIKSNHHSCICPFHLPLQMACSHAMQMLKRGDAILVMDPKLRRNPASTMALEKILMLAKQCLAPSRQSRPSMQKCAEILWGIRKDFREKALSPSSTPHYSANFPVRDAKKTRQTSFGIEDGDSYKFISA